MIILYFFLGAIILNIICAILLCTTNFDNHCDDPECPDSWNSKWDQEIRHIPGGSIKSSKSKSSSSSSKKSEPPGAYSVIGPPNLDHWYYG